MGAAIPITYGEFHDFPRMVQFRFGENWYFLRSYFDDEQDDYSDSYDVYLLPFRSHDEVSANPTYWMKLENSVHLGRIPVGEVGLDNTRRRSVDASMIGSWLATHEKG